MTSDPEQIEQIYRDVVERIVAIRSSLGLTQADVAVALEVSRATINNMENGRSRIMLHQMQKMAVVFGCSMRDLLPEVASDRDAVQEALNIEYGKALEDFLGRWGGLSQSFDKLLDLHVKYVRATSKR